MVLDLAAAGDFAVFLPVQVEQEARKALQQCDLEVALDEWLSCCQVIRYPAPSLHRVEAEQRRIQPLMRHAADVGIAISVEQGRPLAFVSENTQHWTAALGNEIGVPIHNAESFLRAVGIEVPPPPGRQPKSRPSH